MRGTLVMSSALTWRTGIIPAHAGNTRPKPTRTIRPRDHPRACGEHLAASSAAAFASGSSPRMRGTPSSRGFAAGAAGIIPAHAGNTYRGVSRPWIFGDHPRACGEHTFSSEPDKVYRGSSPRMRGTLVPVRTAIHMHGIIPAHAGNTSFGRESTTRIWDHPRACGEHVDHRT